MCLLPSRIIGHREWIRMLASVVMHGDDMHLYYNMISLLWKVILLFALNTIAFLNGYP